MYSTIRRIPVAILQGCLVRVDVKQRQKEVRLTWLLEITYYNGLELEDVRIYV